MDKYKSDNVRTVTNEREQMKKFVDLTTKKDRVAHIKEMLKTNEKWAIRALVRIFEYQTRDEQDSETTRHWNNVGFNGADAEILSSFAKQVNRGRTLSVKQMAILHRRIPKYASQLEKLSTPKSS